MTKKWRIKVRYRGQVVEIVAAGSPTALRAEIEAKAGCKVVSIASLAPRTKK